MNELFIQACNIRYPHDDDYVLNLKKGHPSAWVFIQALSPCEFGTRTGIVNAKYGDCIIYPPNQPQWNKGHGEAIVNNWFHVVGDDVEDIIAKNRVPIGEVFNIQDVTFVQSEILRMRSEIFESWSDNRQALGLLVQLFFLGLGRRINANVDMDLSAGEIVHIESFRVLRQDIRENIQYQWRIHEMAERVGLSRGRFSVLYKKIFRQAPLDDLLHVRLAEAKRLLLNDAMTIEDVARHCGFKSLVYFYRVFKKYFGDSPRRSSTQRIATLKRRSAHSLHHDQ